MLTQNKNIHANTIHRTLIVFYINTSVVTSIKYDSFIKYAKVINNKTTYKKVRINTFCFNKLYTLNVLYTLSISLILHIFNIYFSFIF